MIKEMEYKKSFVEINELLNYLPAKQLELIPQSFISYIAKNMDENYTFKIDKTRDLLNQDYMLETKALLVKIYENFLADESEKAFWNKYDKLCLVEIEKEKKAKYTTNLFPKKNNNTNKVVESTELVRYKENIFSKIKKFFIKFFQK